MSVPLNGVARPPLKAATALWSEEDRFQYTICVRSFEHFCGGRKLFCSTVTVCDQFPRIVFLLLKQKVSGGQEQ